MHGSHSVKREGTFLGIFDRLLGRRADTPLEIQVYRRLKLKGFEPAGIVNVGAYEGNWTRLARNVFPDAPVLMVEAQAAKAAALVAEFSLIDNVTIVNSLLSNRAGEEVIFYEMESGSSILPENSNVPRTERRLTSSTLDDVAADLAGPLLLKIDTQGSELAILSGGAATLARCEAVQLETALLPYNKDAPQIVELLVQMRAWGFVPYDFAGFIRPNGSDLVQTDIVFVREASGFRTSEFRFDI